MQEGSNPLLWLSAGVRCVTNVTDNETWKNNDPDYVTEATKQTAQEHAKDEEATMSHPQFYYFLSIVA
jgi:hypothetical protein